MYTCTDCGAELPNVGALNKHRAKECPKRKVEIPGAPVEGGAVSYEAPKETKEPYGPEPAPPDPEAEAKDRQRMLETVENYARILGLYVCKPGEAVIDVSHLDKGTLAGLYRNAELKFEVIGVLDNQNLLHVHDVRYPRRGR